MLTVNLIHNMKACTECAKLFPLSNFDKSPQGYLGRASKCKPCKFNKYYANPKVRAQKALWKREKCKDSTYRDRLNVLARSPKRYPKKRRARYELMVKMYGLTVEDVARLANAQDCKCAACREKLTFDKTTCIDHDHKTGAVRALLCRGCNLAFGNLKESPERIERLLMYARKVVE